MSRVTYKFNPESTSMNPDERDPMDLLSDIVEDYKQNYVSDKDREVVTPRLPLEKFLETRASFQELFEFNVVTVGHYNDTLFIGHSSLSDEMIDQARDADPVREEAEIIELAIGS